MEDGEPAISFRFSGGVDTGQSFSVIAIHDGYQGEMKVNQAFAWLHDCFRADLRMSFNAWSFEKLVSALDTRALSIRIGTEADMIIISTSSTLHLPEHIKRWLDSILSQQHNRRALLLSLEQDACPISDESHAHIFINELQDLAARWHTEFIQGTDIHHQSSRQIILRRINDLFHCSASTSSDPLTRQPPPNAPPSTQQSINENRLHLTPAQVHAVRSLAYDLWLQADRPTGKEMDFWLAAEQQILASESK